MFWIGMMISLTVAFFAAHPVNRFLLQRLTGHALTHKYHEPHEQPMGASPFIPEWSIGALATVIVAHMLGGLVVLIADAPTAPTG